MGSKIQTSRIVAFGLVILILLALCVGTLYQLQIVDGAQALAESRAHQFSNQTVTAARGNILDRYGRVLVSNRECYNLYINTTRLFGDDVEDPNALILQMVNIVEANGIEWTDDLPITKEPPFEYDENMSALSRRMLEAYFERHGLDEDTSSVELMSYFRTRYEIANSYSSSDMRKISAVRYALNVRYAINTGDYIFVEDASIDLISELMGVVGNIIEVRSSYVREYITQYASHILGYIGSMTQEETETIHKEIGEAVVRVSKEQKKPFLLISRSDSTLRGHYPLETETLRACLEKGGIHADGEIITPYFKDGGRFTIGNIHYVKQGDELVPAAETEFARDKTFGYTHSSLPEYIEEKTKGRYPAESVTCISLEDLRGLRLDQIEEQLMRAENFEKICVNAADDVDLTVFSIALYRAVRNGKYFIFRSAAGLVKVMGGISDRPLLTRTEMIRKESGKGGLVVVGSHTEKTVSHKIALQKQSRPQGEKQV